MGTHLWQPYSGFTQISRSFLLRGQNKTTSFLFGHQVSKLGAPLEAGPKKFAFNLISTQAFRPLRFSHFGLVRLWAPQQGGFTHFFPPPAKPFRFHSPFGAQVFPHRGFGFTIEAIPSLQQKARPFPKGKLVSNHSSPLGFQFQTKTLKGSQSKNSGSHLQSNYPTPQIKGTYLETFFPKQTVSLKCIYR